jgi:hypothetical protein
MELEGLSQGPHQRPTGYKPGLAGFRGTLLIRVEGFTPQPATPLGRPPCRARYPGILGFLTPGSSSRDLLGGRRLITIIYELQKYEQIFWYENHSNWLLLQLCTRSPDIKTAVCGVIVEWPTEGCGRLRGESFYGVHESLRRKRHNS